MVILTFFKENSHLFLRGTRWTPKRLFNVGGNRQRSIVQALKYFYKLKKYNFVCSKLNKFFSINLIKVI